MNMFFLSEVNQVGNNITVLLSIIGGLVTGIGVVWKLYLNSLQEIRAETDKRIADKDKVIATLSAEVKEAREARDKLIFEIKPSLDAANSIAKNVYELLKNGGQK